MQGKEKNHNKNFNGRIIIIGGVAAGTSAAVKARRKSEDAEIVIYEKYKYVSYGTCGLPYFVSGKIDSINSLVINTAAQFEKRFKIQVKVLHEVINIDPHSKTVKVRDLSTQKEFTDSYDKLIISTGTTQIIIDEKLFGAKNTFTLRTIDDAINLKEFINTIADNKNTGVAGNNQYSPSAVIIGGGYIGLELLDALLLKDFNVTIIEKMDHVLPAFDAEIIEYLENYLKDLGIKILKNAEVESFEQDSGGMITKIRLADGSELKSDLIFLGTGSRPDNSLAKQCGLSIGSSGAIVVNEYMQTSDADIYAAGDCCECRDFVSGISQSYYLASIANIQGRCAGYNAAGGDLKFTDSIPTSLIKVADVSAAKTGISLHLAKKLKINAKKIELHALHHAGYYPGASIIHMLVIYDADSGVLLGFEAIGKEGVDKKTDVLSVAIRAKMKIWELIELNLCYHPECGSAKDPVNILGMIGQNIEKGDNSFINVEELRDLINKKEDITIIDVRSEKEFRAGHIKGAINIPVDNLREKISGLDKNSKIIVHCRTSYRSYLAYRILKHAGFANVWNLNGSYMSWERKL